MWDFPTKSLLHTNFLCSLCLVLILPELRIYYIRPVLADTWHLFCFLGWVQSTGADGHLHRFLFPKKNMTSSSEICTNFLHQDSSFIQMQMNLMESIDPEKVETVEKEVRMTWAMCASVWKLMCFDCYAKASGKKEEKEAEKAMETKQDMNHLFFFRLFSCSQIQAWWL